MLPSAKKMMTISRDRGQFFIKAKGILFFDSKKLDCRITETSKKDRGNYHSNFT